jgi:hypothetical protein
MDDGLQRPQDDAPDDADGGMSRRTLIRRTAIAGGAVVWATPVVQSLGEGKAYAWFRGSAEPGGCRCNETVLTIEPVACHAEPGTQRRIAASGKYVTLQATGSADCGDRVGCVAQSETFVWSVLSANGCSLLDQTGNTCTVHVTAAAASITLQVTATLGCHDGRGGSTSCTDSLVSKVCFSQVTGSESQRCGRLEPHPNTTHGTVPCQ